MANALFAALDIVQACDACITGIEADRATAMEKCIAREMSKKRLRWGRPWPWLSYRLPTREQAIRFITYPGAPYYDAKTMHWRQHHECKRIREFAQQVLDKGTGNHLRLEATDAMWLGNYLNKDEADAEAQS